MLFLTSYLKLFDGVAEMFSTASGFPQRGCMLQRKRALVVHQLMGLQFNYTSQSLRGKFCGTVAEFKL